MFVSTSLDEDKPEVVNGVDEALAIATCISEIRAATIWVIT
jgi:hypothetical protein